MIWETLANIPLAQLATFVAGGLMLNVAPGQDVFFASACGIQGGPRAGALAGFGVGLGVLMPWLAYASWHGYRETLDAAAWPALE